MEKKLKWLLEELQQKEKESFIRSFIKIMYITCKIKLQFKQYC